MSFATALFAVVLSAMFRGGPAHLGVYDSNAPALTSVKWRFLTHAKIFSSPTVSGDAVYVGASDGRLYSIRVADGSRIWTFKTNGAINSTPAVADGAVVVSTATATFIPSTRRPGRKNGALPPAASAASRRPESTGSRPRRS